MFLLTFLQNQVVVANVRFVVLIRSFFAPYLEGLFPGAPSEAPDDSFSSACPLTKTFNPPMRIWPGGKPFGIGMVQGIGTRDCTIPEGLGMQIPAMRADASPASGLGRAMKYAGGSVSLQERGRILC